MNDPTPILLDCDPGHDDAIALLLALASPELDLLGVTTVAGNQTLEKTTANALRVLELVGRSDVDVAAGADRPLARELFIAAYVHGESGLDGPSLPDPQRAPADQHAVEFLAERILGSPRPVTLVPVGPLTNIALLFAHHPEAAENVERIVIMGGAIAEGNVTPAAEFNIYVDPEAAWRVFHSGVPMTMIGLDVTHKALMMSSHVERLRASGTAGTFVAELHDFFVEYHKRTYGTEGAPIHDAVAVAQVLRPGIVETLHRHVDVDCESQLCRGRTVVDLWHRTENEPNADVGVDIDADGFLELLCERVESLDRSPTK